MKYLKRFINDLLYGNPALSNLKWEIIEDIRGKTGYYTMDKIPFSNAHKWVEILMHKRRPINEKDYRKLMKAIINYNNAMEVLR